MTHTEVTTVLRQFNEWRRDDDYILPQPDPREIGMAIDAAVEMIESVRKAWARFCNKLHSSPDAPYPGMSEAFEQHFSQSFTDREWRAESATWASAWKAAKRHEAQGQPASSEGSITAGILSGMFLSLDGHDKAQPGYEWRKGWNDAIRQAMDYAQPAPSIPEGWLRAIDEALVVAHIGVANESDTFEQAREKLDNLIGFHVDVASDPAVNGGWKLVPIEPMPSMPKLHVGYLPTINQDGYPALGAWWVQLWDGDDVFARVYGSSPEEAHNRAEMLAAAPEAKP